MRIKGISSVFPLQKLTNSDVLERIRLHSVNSFNGNLNQAIERIRHTLELSGAKERFWTTEADDHLDMVKRAAAEALLAAEMEAQEIDFVIHAGIERKVAEPGESHFIAKEIGAHKAICFDIISACSSWSKAVFVAQGLLQSGRYKKILIVTTETHMTPGKFVYPVNFSLNSLEELSWKFPSYTLGDNVTATVLTDESEDWRFEIISKPEWAHLCVVPFEGFETYLRDFNGKQESMLRRFVSFGREMQICGFGPSVEVFQRLNIGRKDLDIIFPHSSSKRVWDEGAAKLGLSELLYHVYPRTGNVAAASLPTGISLALREGKLKRGDRVLCWMSAAGMSFIAIYFEF